MPEIETRLAQTGAPTIQRWTHEELEEAWTLGPDEHALLGGKRGPTRLGFAVLIRFFARHGRFPATEEIDEAAVEYVAAQVDVVAAEYHSYDHRGRTAEYHRAQLREAFGFRPATTEDAAELADWLLGEVAPYEYDAKRLTDAAYTRLRRSLKIEPPTPGRVDRLVRSSLRSYDERFCETILGRLSENSVAEMDALLSEPDVPEIVYSDGAGDRISGRTLPTLARLRNDPGRASAESARIEIAKLSRLRAVGLPHDLFRDASPKVVRSYRRRAVSESPSSLRAHPPGIRYTLLSALCFMRLREVTDGLVEVLIQIVHKIGARSEKKIERVLLEDFKKVSGKHGLLFRVAEAALGNPDGLVREVVFPVVGEETLSKVVKEAKNTGAAYQEQVQLKMRSSYVSYYRPVISAVLGSLEFRSNNAAHRPVIQALGLLKAYAGSTKRFYEDDDDVPVEGVVPAGWHELVFKSDGKGPDRNGLVRIDRVVYELCVLGALWDGLRSKEICVVGADRYRNPDDDLPRDFDERRERYYEALGQPMEADRFVEGLRQEMETSLAMLDENVPHNPYLRLHDKGNARISLSPLPAQPEPPNLDDLGIEIAGRWPMTSLLDILKEADLRLGLTDHFTTVASRQILDSGTLRKRLLLCLYGLGTNTGLKRISAGDSESGYQDLRYVRRRFVHKEQLRAAIACVVNGIFSARSADIWGEATTACASDSKKFGSWDQNLLTSWSIRHRGRGIMIYWHVDKKSACIYSQLKSVSSSEVAAMIEGVLRHCTTMSVDRNYVDSHGQSEVAFAFSHILGFRLMPRLKRLSAQRLYRPGKGNPGAYPNLQPILTRPIDWTLIRNQYDQMVRFVSALHSGTAETESILRRFTRANLQHPTYRALCELGRAVKTIFLCEYLSSMQTRREIHEGLNVIESWNSTNSFIFYGKGGEISTNRLEDQEVAVLSLHLLQICLVYVNTLMI